MAAKKPVSGDAPQSDAPPDTIVLYHPEAWSGALAVGDKTYAVQDGVVAILPEHAAAAQQAGFRPEGA